MTSRCIRAAAAALPGPASAEKLRSFKLKSLEGTYDTYRDRGFEPGDDVRLEQQIQKTLAP